MKKETFSFVKWKIKQNYNLELSVVKLQPSAKQKVTDVKYTAINTTT